MINSISLLRGRWGLFVFWLLALMGDCARAQENIPLAQWRTHFSFSRVHRLTTGGSAIFAAADNAVMRLDREDNSFTVYSTLNALSSTGITALGYDATRDRLLVGYETGRLDLIGENSIIHFTKLINPPDVGVPGVINHIFVEGNNAYLSTLYGVVVFDLLRNEVRETWRDLGVNGQPLSIRSTTILNDSIYLATPVGVLKGNLNDNLLDFNQWTRFSNGNFSSGVATLAVFNQRVYAALPTIGVVRYTGASWSATTLPILDEYNFLYGNGNNLLVGGEEGVWQLTGTNLTQLTHALISNVNDAAILGNSLVLADEVNGLVLGENGIWSTNVPNGPVRPFVFNTGFVLGQVVATHGGFDNQLQSGDAVKSLSTFSQGLWSATNTEVGYLSDVEAAGDALCAASFGDGIEVITASGSVRFDPTNSPLRYVTDLTPSSSGVWIANYNNAAPLHLLNDEMNLEPVSIGVSAARYPLALAADASENIWMLIGPAGGNGVLVVKSDGTPLRYLTDQPNGGLLPSESVLSIAVDKNDFVWIGTAKGIAYYTYYDEDGIRPIVDGRYLLNDERITALAVDAGDRKWIGTERGVWLFNAAGEEAIYNFTTDNSPLPSNVVTDITIDGKTGEVFFTTDKGLVSFRADATDADPQAEAIIFPNPVARDFAGLVGITGVVDNAILKITNVEGRLVNQLQANGGSASWNLTDYNGRRVANGVYVVVALAQDGSESVAGKIVVVD